jgi:hypothetical protein
VLKLNQHGGCTAAGAGRVLSEYYCYVVISNFDEFLLRVNKIFLVAILSVLELDN